MLPQLISASSLRSQARFTIRELLLAMTAAGALLGLALQSGSWFGPTPFFTRFNPFQAARQAMEDEGVEVGAIPGDRGAEHGGRVARQIFAFSLDAGELPPEQAMEAFRKRVEQDLKACGATITGRRYIGRPDSNDLQRFCYLYEDNWRKGELIAYLIPGEPGEFKVTGTVHEF